MLDDRTLRELLYPIVVGGVLGIFGLMAAWIRRVEKALEDMHRQVAVNTNDAAHLIEDVRDLTRRIGARELGAEMSLRESRGS